MWRRRNEFAESIEAAALTGGGSPRRRDIRGFQLVDELL